jgi:hypothetical protein
MSFRLNRRAFLAGLAWAACPRVPAAEPSAEERVRQASERIAAIEARAGGRLGVAVLDTGSGAQIRRRADERFPMCSTFKLIASGSSRLSTRSPRNGAPRFAEASTRTRTLPGRGSWSGRSSSDRRPPSLSRRLAFMALPPCARLRGLVSAYAKKDVAWLPDDDPSLALDVRLEPVGPHASVTPVQFVGNGHGRLAVRERHSERLAAVVHLGPQTHRGLPAWID